MLGFNYFNFILCFNFINLTIINLLFNFIDFIITNFNSKNCYFKYFATINLKMYYFVLIIKIYYFNY